MPDDWKIIKEEYERFVELAKELDFKLIVTLQHPRPPGYSPPSRYGQDVIIIDYPGTLSWPSQKKELLKSHQALIKTYNSVATESTERADLVILLTQGLKFFLESFYGDEWVNQLHEEGCIGVELRPNERDSGLKCKCDGDWRVSQIQKLMKRHPKLQRNSFYSIPPDHQKPRRKNA